MTFRSEFQGIIYYISGRCNYCHEKIPKGEGLESMAAFERVHRECLEKMQDEKLDILQKR